MNAIIDENTSIRHRVGMGDIFKWNALTHELTIQIPVEGQGDMYMRTDFSVECPTLSEAEHMVETICSAISLQFQKFDPWISNKADELEKDKELFYYWELPFPEKLAIYDKITS